MTMHSNDSAAGHPCCAIIAAALLVLSVSPPAAAQYSMGTSVVGSGATEASGGGYTLRGTVGQPAVGHSATGDNHLWAGFWYARGAMLPPPMVFANLRILLEGPYAGSRSMSTALNPAHLPTSQPYGGAAFEGKPVFYEGPESASPVPSGAVDWVVVELRSGTAASDSVSARAGLVMSDGFVRDTDGSSLLEFPGLDTGPYYVVVRHRNHLPVMSSGTVIVGPSPPAYDFTDAMSKAYTPLGDPMASLGDGYFGLFACDANRDGVVNYFNPFSGDDRTAVLAALAGDVTAEMTGYFLADVNLDGKVNYFNPFTGDDRTGILQALGGNVTQEYVSQVPD